MKKLISADKSAGKETWMNFDRDGQAEIIHCDCTRKAELASGQAGDVPLQPDRKVHADQRPAARRTQEEKECMAAISSLLERAAQLQCALAHP